MSSEAVFTLNWTIENFSLFSAEIRSRIFSIDKLKNMSLTFNPNSFEKPIYILISRRHGDGGLPFHNFDMAIDVILPDGKNLESIKKRREVFLKKDNSSKFIMLPVTYQQLVSEINKSGEDYIIIRCRIFTENPEPDVAFKTKIRFSQYYCELPLDFRVRDSNGNQTKKYNLIDGSSIETTVSTPDENVSIQLRIVGATFHIIKAQVSLFDSYNTKLLSKIDTLRFREKTNLWHFPKFLKSNELNKTRYLIFEFSVPSGLEVIIIDNLMRGRTESVARDDAILSDMASLQSDFRAMYEGEEYADMELKTKESRFKVHRNVLSARSPVFSAMLKQNMLENETGVVDIEDVEAATMKDFLEFLYTGSLLQLDYEKALNLLVAADKYQVLSLKEKCSEFLLSKLSNENVTELIYVSDLISLKPLKESALDYVVKNSEEIMLSEKWIQWSKENSLLAVEILPRLATYNAALKSKAGK